MNSWRIALLYNLQHPALVEPEAPPDALVDFDTPETVAAVEQALLADGHEVFPLEADHTLLDTIREVNPDLCFNMAKGVHGNEREAQVPALLEMLNLPYTGSTGMGHALARNKAAAKRIWQDMGLPTTSFQLMESGEDQPGAHLGPFPLFVKPAHESAGMGVNRDAIVRDEASLRARVQWVVDTYQQPALVEPYLPGREFSVAILGNSRGPKGRRSTQPSQYALPVLETLSDSQDFEHDDTRRLVRRHLCPADMDPDLAQRLQHLAIAAFDAIGALDVARVDFRLDASGAPYLLDIDVMPSLDPLHSRLVRMAAAYGLTFAQLITAITRAALDRYALSHEPSPQQVQRRPLPPLVGSWQSSPA
jgi:D-alanine-D-alanine ligase